MERYLSNPNVDKTVVNTIQVYEGGTGGTTVKEAQDNLDILDKSTVGAPNGLAIIPTNGLFGGSVEGGVSDTPMIDGPSYVRTNQTNKFFITNYDIKTDYLLSTDMGSITREEDYLVFKSGPDVGVATIRVNNLEVKLDIFLALINMPNIVYPASGDDTINSKVEIKTTEFITGEVNTFHAYTDWELSTTVTMDNIFKSVEKSANFLTNWKVEGLQENVTYYIRFRYWDNVGNKSSWSEVTQFKTRVTFAPEKPIIISPPNGTDEQKADINFTSSDFFTYEDVTHVSSDWEFSTSSVFAGLFLESEADETNKTTWTVGGLNTSTLYYVRVRYTDSRGRKSDWSDPSRIRTRKSFAAETPFIINPGNSTDGHNSRVGIASSVFSGGDSRVTHQSSDWEVSEDTSFQYPFVKSYSNSNDKSYWVAKKLKPATTYYVRVRYRDTMGYVTDWSKPIQFKTKDSFSPSRPTITEPISAKTDVGPWLAMRSAAYVSNNEGDEHLNSDWEIGSSISFADLVKWNTAADNDKITWTVKGLEEGSQYFVRIRHRSSIDGEEFVSDWSSPISFSTKVTFAPGKPTITYPRSGSKDVSENLNITSTNYLPSDSQDVHVNSDWEISTNSGFTDIVQSNYGSAVAKTLWQVTNMRSLTTFFVRVRHRTINDGIYYVSDWSSTNNFTVEHTVPATPVILIPSNGSDKVDTNPLITSSAYLAGEVEEKHFASSWQIATDAAFTDIVLLLQSSTTNKVSWQVEGLENATTYYVKVKHIGNLGFESEWSAPSQFNTKAAIVTQAPKILKPTEGAVNVDPAGSITSSSFATSDPTDSHLSSDWELSLEPSFASVVKSEYGSMVSKTSWVPGGLLNQTDYYVRVRHKGSLSGPTGWSTTCSFTTKAAAFSQAPSITNPSNNAVNVLTTVEITSSNFATSDPSDTHQSSDWQLSTSSSFSPLVSSVTESLANKTKWTPTGLKENSTYYVRVRHTGSITGPTGWSTTSSFTTKAPAYNQAPTITSPANNATGINTTISITSSNFATSDPSDSHKSSDWQLSTSSSFSPLLKSETGSLSNKTSWLVSGLTNDKTYYVRVKHTGSVSGSTAWSVVSSFKTKSPDVVGSVAKPSITSPSSGSTGLNTSFTVTGSAFSSGASGDSHNSSDWEVATDIGFGAVVKSSADNTTSKTSWPVGGLTAGSTYYIRVRYKGVKGGLSPWSDGVMFTTKSGSGGGTDPGPVVVVEGKGLSLKDNTAFTKDAGFFYQKNYPGTSVGAPYGLFLHGYNLTPSGFQASSGVPPGPYDNIFEQNRTPSTFTITRVSEDKSKVAFFSYEPTPPPQLPIYTSTIRQTQVRGGVKVGVFDPDGAVKNQIGVPGEFNGWGGFIHGDLNLSTVGVEYNGYIYIYKERDTDSGLKYAYVAKVTAPSEYGATAFGQRFYITDDGKLLFSLAAGNVIYVFSIESNTVTFRFRLKSLVPDFKSWSFSSDGSSLVIGPYYDNKVYVYERSGGEFEWVQSAVIEAGVTAIWQATYQLERGNVCITGDGSMITIMGMEGSYGTNKKPAHTFYKYLKSGSGTWVQVYKYTPPVPDYGLLYDLGTADRYHYTAKDGSLSIMNGNTYLISDELYGVNVYIFSSEGGTSPESVSTPSITSPSSGSSLSPDGVSFTSSAFSSSSSSATHSNSDWEIATNSAFTTIVKSVYASTSDKTSWSVSGLTAGATYYVRVKHVSSGGAESAWSNMVSFSTTVVQIPGSNGKVKIDIPGSILNAASKTGLTFINTVYGGAGVNGSTYTNLTKINRNGEVVQETRLRAGGGFDAYDYAVEGALRHIYATGFSSGDSDFFFLYEYQIGYGQYTTYIKALSTTSAPMGSYDNQDPLAAILLKPGLSVLANNSDFSKFILQEGGTVSVYSLRVRDSGGKEYILASTIGVPAGNYPDNWGMKLGISGDGNTACIIGNYGYGKGGSYAYMFTANNDQWVFKEKIKLPTEEPVTIELSNDGSVMVVGCGLKKVAGVYSKVGDSWSNQQVIYPGDVDSPTSPLDITGALKTFACVSDDGNTISVSCFSEYNRIYLYKKQPDGNWGEVGILKEPPPSIGVAEYTVTSGYHRLSADGTMCIFTSDFYRVTSGATVRFPGYAYLAY